MIAPDHDRRGDLAGRNEIVDGDAESRSLALSQPADARRQALKCDSLRSELDPPTEMSVVGEELDRETIGARDVGRIAGQSHPAEWSLAVAEQRSHVLRDEARDVERIRDTGVVRHGADVVSVVEGDRAAPLHLEHRADMY